MEETKPKKKYITCTELRAEARKALSGNWKKVVLMCLLYALLTVGIYAILNTIFGAILNLVRDVRLIALFIICLNLILTLTLSLVLLSGVIISHMKIRRGEDVSITGFIKLGMGNGNFKRNMQIALNIVLRIIIPFIIIFVSLIVIIAVFITSATYAIMGIGEAFLNMYAPVLQFVVVALIIGIVWFTIIGLKYVLIYNIAYDEPELPAKEVVRKSRITMDGKCGNYFVLMLSFIGWGILSELTFGIGILWLLPYMVETHACFYDRIKEQEQTPVQTN